MYGMNRLLDACRNIVRLYMRMLAHGLNKLSGGKLKPSTITLISLLAHFLIAWLVAVDRLSLAAIMLIVFGLFDALDGELARLQKSSSPKGMFLDSTTDRFKEVLLYCGITAYLLNLGNDTAVLVAVAALGVSICTSYINAWGEVVMATSVNNSSHQINKAFRTGYLGFEIRMFLIVVGLLANKLEIIVYIILVLAVITALQRSLNIMQRLEDAQS